MIARSVKADYGEKCIEGHSKCEGFPTGNSTTSIPEARPQSSRFWTPAHTRGACEVVLWKFDGGILTSFSIMVPSPSVPPILTLTP